MIQLLYGTQEKSMKEVNICQIILERMKRQKSFVDLIEKVQALQLESLL